MNLKWYYSTFIIILALLGVGQQQNTTPNQEIVVQFANSNSEAQTTITAVKEQLQRLGVENLQIDEDEKGNVTISYFSNINVAGIKQILADNNLYVNLSDSNLPLDKQGSKKFNLDIYEINSKQSNNIDLNAYIVEAKAESDRILNPNILIFHEFEELKQKEVLYKPKNIFRTIAIAIGNTSYKIPEVRAGPLV